MEASKETDASSLGVEGSYRGPVAGGEQIIKDYAVGDERFGGRSEKYFYKKVNSGGKETDYH